MTLTDTRILREVVCDLVSQEIEVCKVTKDGMERKRDIGGEIGSQPYKESGWQRRDIEHR